MSWVQYLLVTEFIAVVLADITAAILVFRVYLQNRRTSALAFSLAWVFDLIFVVASMKPNEPLIEAIGLLSLPTFGGLLLYGSVKFLEEESLSVSHRTLSLFATMPPAFMLYMLSVYYYTGDPVWTAKIASSLGISGVFVVSGGMLLWEVKEIYKSAVKYLSIGVILFGLHLIPAAIFGKTELYKVAGFTLSTVLIILMVWAMIKLTSSKAFQVVGPNGEVELDLKPGVMIVDTRDYPQIREHLRDVPVLAFLRDISDVPEKWETYFVTTIPFEGKFKGTITPTNLAKMTELSYQYLEALSKAGKKGIILIDCFEYLMVYNSWESLMKFLSKLRDIILVNKGTLIIVLEKGSLSEHKYLQLRKLLG
ncbi:DUF835 domain-containing protein [Thermococcus sp.]|uniref:DUF835 domain-containing protein n=1 Tax=Thermococcus sp. TaxID=35749 RepID=UPI0026175751|nr:DUF835 domain-containing protein [Thermococcus sp.]